MVRSQLPRNRGHVHSTPGKVAFADRPDTLQMFPALVQRGVIFCHACTEALRSLEQQISAHPTKSAPFGVAAGAGHRNGDHMRH